MLDARTIHGREVLSRVTDAFGGQAVQDHHSQTIKFAEAPVAGEPIVTYAPKSGGATGISGARKGGDVPMTRRASLPGVDELIRSQKEKPEESQVTRYQVYK